MTGMPNLTVSAVYRVVADTLPREGRDYGIEFTTGENGEQRVLLRGFTPMGVAWLPFLRERLSPHDTQDAAADRDPGDDVRLQARIRDQGLAEFRSL